MVFRAKEALHFQGQGSDGPRKRCIFRVKKALDQGSAAFSGLRKRLAEEALQFQGQGSAAPWKHCSLRAKGVFGTTMSQEYLKTASVESLPFNFLLPSNLTLGNFPFT